MILWNTRELARRIQTQTLTDRERFQYYLLFTVLVALIPLAIYHEKMDYRVFTVSTALSALINALGVIWVYLLHKKNPKTAFLDQVLCLPFPITIRMIVFFFLPFSLVFSGTGMNIEGDAVAAGINVLAEIIIYWRLIVWVRRIGSSEI